MWTLWSLAAILAGSPVGLVNGSFELDADADGAPDGWQAAGDGGVVQRLQRVPEGDGFAARLACTAFRHSGAASHAMLAQVGHVRVVEGQWYRLSLRVRAEGLVAGAIDVALSDTATWSNCGLSGGLLCERDWRTRAIEFRATRTVAETTRLQFWWGSVGMVWFDDMILEPIAAPRRIYLERLAPAAGANRLPNSGFECGVAGWGSLTDVPGWGGNLTGLVGRPDGAEPHSGGSCLRIDVDPEQHEHDIYFDYFTPYRVPCRMPLAANRGWIDVEPGQAYTFSAWVRADRDGLPVALRIHQASGRPLVRQAAARTAWTRLVLTERPSAAQVFCAVGPDLRQFELGRGTLWIDDVQFEPGEAATEYRPRDGAEHGVRSQRFAVGEGPAMRRDDRAEVSGEADPRALEAAFTDFDGRALEPEQTRLVANLRPASAVVPIAGMAQNGFHRVTVAAPWAATTPSRSIRLLAMPVTGRGDTICGMNHAYPTPHLMACSREIGIGWVRDWSYQWRVVEPEPGRFDYALPDLGLQRALDAGQRVLVLLPFPSAPWSSSAPEAENGRQLSELERCACAPRDEAAFRRYVYETVAHLRGKVDAFEVFNEPVYTEYSLPRERGYTVEDYVKWLRIASAAVREANPQATVIGGIQSGPENLTAEFIAAGGLEAIDALSLHVYPGLKAPEFLVEGLGNLRAMMAAVGRGETPLWWTEGAYYADDDPAFEPFEGWLTPLPDERLQAIYTVRLNAILCGHDTRRIIYHSGTPGAINQESHDGVFFEYGGEPRKVAAAVAGFDAMMPPDFISRGRLPSSPEVYAFAFEVDGRQQVIAWTLGEPVAMPLAGGWEAYDLFGNRLPAGGVILSEAPRYLRAPLGARDPSLP